MDLKAGEIIASSNVHTKSLLISQLWGQDPGWTPCGLPNAKCTTGRPGIPLIIGYNIRHPIQIDTYIILVAK